MSQEKSCGAVIVCGHEYIIIKHRPERGGHWDFPKGQQKGTETEKETAAREVYEETGIRIKFFDGFKETTTYYPKPGVLKTVTWFVGFCEKKKFNPITGEIIEHQWLPYDKALKLLTFENGKQLLKKANEFLQFH